MKKAVFLLSFVLLLFSLNTFADDSPRIDSEAVEASENFLLLLDAEDYDTAWEQSSSLLKIIKSKEEWIRELKIAHELFGSQINRTIKITKEFPTWIGLPDGDYNLIIVSTSFEKKKEGMQSLVLTLDTDGKWRVVEYTAR